MSPQMEHSYHSGRMDAALFWFGQAEASGRRVFSARPDAGHSTITARPSGAPWRPISIPPWLIDTFEPVLLGLTGFYWVLLGFTGFQSSYTGFQSSYTGFYRVLLGFTGFYWVLLGFNLVILGFTGFYWVLLGFTGFYWVLMGFTGFYWVLLGFTGFY